MKTYTILLTVFSLSLFQLEAQDKILVFTKTNGFRHGSITAGVNMISELGVSNGLWAVDQTEEASDFNENNLSQYKAVVWCNTSGNNLLNADQQQAFENFIANGGGFLGIHAATDTYRDGSWSFYNELVGAIVQTNPNHTSNNFNADMTILSSHPAVDFLGNIGEVWNKSEEYYYWKNNGGFLYSGNINLLEVESTGSNDYDVPRPISWYKEYEGGRTFYTALGHNSSDYTDNTNFIRHVEEGIKYVIGNTLSIQNFDAEQQFELFSSVVQDQLTVYDLKQDAEKKILVYDIHGQLVYSKRYSSNINAITIDIHHLSDGLYIGEMVKKGRKQSFKFIKS